MRAFLVCAALAGMYTAVAAQGGERTSGGQSPLRDPVFERMGREQSPFSRSLSGTIVSLSANNTVIIQRRDGSRLSFSVDGKSRLRADSGTYLGAKKDITLSDYRPGDWVRVTYRLENSRVLEIRLRRSDH